MPGLIVNGTITRTPVATGAELVGYSGFSASNYLEQPYNSALDFGTGDFCVMGWGKASAGEIRFFHRRSPDYPTDPTRIDIQTTAGVLAAYLSPTSHVSTSPVLNAGQWNMIAVVRKSSVVTLYVNGVSVYSGADTNNLTDTDATIRTGTRQDGSASHGTASIALLRISATAPTAEQIKKIYEDEKVLFQENAAATLYGASDAVTALAHDEDTGLLHVGTSAGRSVFQGLRRVSNTTTAVGTAISASNGLVVEE